MRRIVFFMHVSLDGYVANSKGEMNWVKVDQEMFDLSFEQTNRSDTAIYGRKTFELMESYWPTAADKPNATKHDIEHSTWYKAVEKIVISRTLRDSDKLKLSVIGSDVISEIKKLKSKEGKDIVIFGSPSICQLLLKENMIDDYWIFVNPIILGGGKLLFNPLEKRIDLQLESSKVFKSGVVCNHYTLK